VTAKTRQKLVKNAGSVAAIVLLVVIENGPSVRLLRMRVRVCAICSPHTSAVALLC